MRKVLIGAILFLAATITCVFAFEIPFTGYDVFGSSDTGYVCETVTDSSGYVEINEEDLNASEFKLAGVNQEGFNRFEKGKVRQVRYYATGKELYKAPRNDICKNKKELKEYYCAEDSKGRWKVKSEEISCTQGCLNGACIADETVSSGVCADSDHLGSPGYDAEQLKTPGSATEGDTVLKDTCDGSNRLKEGYCNSRGKAKYKTNDDGRGVRCPEGFECKYDSEQQAYCVDKEVDEGTAPCSGPTLQELDPLNVGTATTTDGPISDECSSDSKVIEYYCEKGVRKSKESSCPAAYPNCQGGRCSIRGEIATKESLKTMDDLIISRILSIEYTLCLQDRDYEFCSNSRCSAFFRAHGRTDCSDENEWCDGGDLDRSGDVGSSDFNIIRNERVC